MDDLKSTYIRMHICYKQQARKQPLALAQIIGLGEVMIEGFIN